MPRKRPIGMAPWSPEPKAQALVDVVLAHEEEWPMLVRRALYLAHEARPDLWPSKTGKGPYNAAIDALGRARRAGLVPWRAIADKSIRRDQYGWSSLAEFARGIRASARGYERQHQEGQPYWVIVWCEHDGLERVLAETANEFGVSFVSSGGFDGHAVRWYSAQDAVYRTDESDQRTVVLHFGDRDLKGEEVYERVKKDVLAFYAHQNGPEELTPIFERTALTIDQMTEYKLIGPDVQIDALSPDTLRDIMRKAIARWQDADILADVLAREAEERERAIRLVEELLGEEDYE